MQTYWKHIKPYLIFFVMTPAFMVLEVYADVQIPTLSARIINEGILENDTTRILMLAVQMILTLCMAVTTGVGAAYCSMKASANFAHDLRDEVFSKIQEFSFKSIDKFSTGSLVTRLTNDITQIAQLVNMFLRMIFRSAGMLIGSTIMAYQLSPSLSKIFLVLVPILVVIIWVILHLAFPKFKLLQEKVDALNTTIQEGLLNIRVIKAFTREKHEEAKFETVNADLKNTALGAYRINMLQSPLMTISVNMATICILWFGSQALGRGEILVGDISAMITYLTQILMSVNMVANVFMQASRSLVSVRRLSEILDETIDISDLTAKKPEKTVDSGAVVFENVSFQYFENSEENVLSHINLTIASGETVGIVGSTGSGKTSFVQLIPRLYDVTSGRILVDGVDIKEYSLRNLREGVAMVLQQNLLFSGTIKENLCWGKVDASDEEIKQNAEFAAAKQFIEEMTDGYDAILHQGGLNLSGGQKQRMCIARALIKKTKILILDDSTSAVDTATESKIRKHLQHDLKDMTKIIIAQRITSIKHADKIVVLDEGEISAVGTHEELLETSKVYQEIFNSQVDNAEVTKDGEEIAREEKQEEKKKMKRPNDGRPPNGRPPHDRPPHDRPPHGKLEKGGV
ncbi:MAG: ABC transporter ATP-binding protein [Bacillota bacterium]